MGEMAWSYCITGVVATDEEEAEAREDEDDGDGEDEGDGVGIGIAMEATGEAGVGGQSAKPRPTPSRLTAASSHCGTAWISSCVRALPSRVGGRDSSCAMVPGCFASFELRRRARQMPGCVAGLGKGEHCGEGTFLWGGRLFSPVTVLGGVTVAATRASSRVQARSAVLRRKHCRQHQEARAR